MSSSGPMIASTFWKNTMPLCTGCDQLTAVSSSWWEAKLPAVWKNFFGRMGARSRTSASRSRSPARGGPQPLPRLAALAAALEVRPGRRHVELDDVLALEPRDAALVEGDE